ncbi:MAG: (Fe-S)-binding protein [Candidatus Portiera sp.]|nr:(Fe-S)-binding protein [Portiera sp.]
MQGFLVNQLPLLLLGIALLGFTAGVIKRIGLWRQGRHDQALKLSNIFFIPKRYLVDLHHIVARDTYIANTHIAAAGGVVASVLLMIPIYGFGLTNFYLYMALFLATFSAFIGGIFVWRRRSGRPSRLSRGKWNGVPIALLSFSIGFGFLTLFQSGYINANSVSIISIVVLSALATLGIFEIAGGGLLNRPFKHLLSGSLHLAFHPRQARFKSKGALSTDLKPVDWEVAKEIGTPGVKSVKDFAWNRLLSFDACIECGKCETACPAFAAEQPLNPKKLIQDFVAGMENRNDLAYAGSPTPGIPLGEHGGNSSSPIISDLVEEDTIWSCTSCRACVQECPMMIEHVDAIIDVRRDLTMRRGNIPETTAEALENLRQTDNIGGNDPKQRANWSLDLGVAMLKDGEKTDVLFWPGEAAFELKHQKTLRLVAQLMQKAGIEFAIPDLREADIGDFARRVGEEVLFETMVKKNMDLLSNYTFNKIVTADPHVYHSLKNEYSSYGGDYQIFHHTEFLLQMLEEGKISVKEKISDRTYTYHDPCYLGRYNSVVDAPRALLAMTVENITEMDKSGMNSRCCGWGGGAAFSDIPGKRRIPDMRMEDAQQTKVDTLVVSCPNCMTMLDGVVATSESLGPLPEVVDIAEVTARAVAL